MFTPIITTPGGTISDGLLARNLSFSWDKHGAAVCTYELPIAPDEQLLLVARPVGAFVEVWDSGALAWRGRMTAVNIERNVAYITAHGSQFEFDRITLAHYWVKTGVADWVQAVDTNNQLYPFTNARQNQKFTCDNNNRLYMALTKGNAYLANETCSWYLLPVHSAFPETTATAALTRPIRRVILSYSILLPANWEFRIVGEHVANPAISADIVVWNTLVATGVLQTGTINVDVSANRRYAVRVNIVNATGATYNMAAETGTFYANLTGIQVLTSIGATCRASEIVQNLAAVTALFITNSGVSANTASVVDAGQDLQNETYEDVTGRYILDRLAGYGDTANTPYNWWVDNNGMVFFGPYTRFAREYTVLEGQFSTKVDSRSVTTASYGVYRDERGRPFRAPIWQSNVFEASTVDRRFSHISVNTTSATVAQQANRASLDNQTGNRGRVTCNKVLYANGADAPFWELRAGDTIYLSQAFAAGLGGQLALDRFRLSGWEWDNERQVLTLYPEDELESVANML